MFSLFKKKKYGIQKVTLTLQEEFKGSITFDMVTGNISFESSNGLPFTQEVQYNYEVIC